jgi:hypothetical protein
MRAGIASLAVLGLLACDRRGDRDNAADSDRPSTDTATVSTAGDPAARDSLDWRPAPPGLPKGARGAVLKGDPSKPGPYTSRMEMPAGYQVAPHHHPMREHARVLQGTVMVGRGKKWDDAKLKPLAPGEEMTIAAQEPHFVEVKDQVLIEVQGTGPFQITYENPADDPRKTPLP